MFGLVHNQVIFREDFFNQFLVCFRHDSFRLNPAVADLLCVVCKFRSLRCEVFADVYSIVWVFVIVTLVFGVPHRLTPGQYDYRPFTRASVFVNSISNVVTSIQIFRSYVIQSQFRYCISH